MKNKKVLIFLLVGLAIMAVMLYFIGIGEVIEALKESNLWLVLLAIVIGLVVVILIFQQRNKNLLNQVKHVSFQQTNSNNNNVDPNLLLQKSQNNNEQQ